LILSHKNSVDLAHSNLIIVSNVAQKVQIACLVKKATLSTLKANAQKILVALEILQTNVLNAIKIHSSNLK